MIHYHLAEVVEAAEGMDGVVEQVSDIIDKAGNTAGSFVTGLPVLTTKVLMSAVVVFIGAILIRLGHRMILSLIKSRTSKVVRNPQQVDTMRSLVNSLFNYVMYFIIATVVLSIFGVNVSSLLTVAGVGGVAIAFGGQTLVKDVISGLFIWVEGSLTVGDWVVINDLQGSVEAVAIRTTVIRDFNGSLYTIPNGDIRTITNMSRDYKRAVVDIRCPYEADQAYLVKIITEEMEKAGREIDGLTAPPAIMSILAFEPDCVLMRVAAQCPVGQQWRIEFDLRTRIKARFDAEGIVMPHYQKPPVA